MKSCSRSSWKGYLGEWLSCRGFLRRSTHKNYVRRRISQINSVKYLSHLLDASSLAPLAEPWPSQTSREWKLAMYLEQLGGVTGCVHIQQCGTYLSLDVRAHMYFPEEALWQLGPCPCCTSCPNQIVTIMPESARRPTSPKVGAAAQR
jgi:hypothetical protein